MHRPVFLLTFLPVVLSIGIAASPSACRERIVNLSFSAIEARTSMRILLIISNIHSCPSVISVMVDGISKILTRTPSCEKYCNSFFASSLFLLNLSSDLIYNVSPSTNLPIPIFNDWYPGRLKSLPLALSVTIISSDTYCLKAISCLSKFCSLLLTRAYPTIFSI